MHNTTIIFLVLAFLLTSCLPAVFVGTAGSAIMIAKDQSLGETVDDIKIAAKIRTSFMKNNFKTLYTKIKVEVIQGRILLTGIIDTEEEALKAVELVWTIYGVQEVINELMVDKKSNHFFLEEYTQDSMITAQIKSKLFINHDIKFVNYTIVTVKHIVYIFGIARTQQELEKVSTIASYIKGVEKVVCHAKIKTNNKANLEDEEINKNDDY